MTVHLYLLAVMLLALLGLVWVASVFAGVVRYKSVDCCMQVERDPSVEHERVRMACLQQGTRILSFCRNTCRTMNSVLRVGGNKSLLASLSVVFVRDLTRFMHGIAYSPCVVEMPLAVIRTRATRASGAGRPGPDYRDLDL